MEYITQKLLHSKFDDRTWSGIYNTLLIWALFWTYFVTWSLNLVHLKRLGLKETIKLTLLRFFDDSLSEGLILLKKLLHAMNAIIRKGSETSAWFTFSAWFSIKMFLWMSYLFSFSRHQTKCVIKFLIRQLMVS